MSNPSERNGVDSMVSIGMPGKRHDRRQQVAGFSLIEIGIVLGIVGIVTALATPMFLRYYQGAQLTAAARQLATTLNSGRQLAISANDSVCVHSAPASLHFHMGTCASAVETPTAAPHDGGYWVGAGTSAAGNFAIPGGMAITTTANPQFTYLGAAAPGATYTVRNTQTSTTLTVTVAASGRITVP
jgi:type II secretory pathway pseudopilin PulG